MAYFWYRCKECGTTNCEYDGDIDYADLAAIFPIATNENMKIAEEVLKLYYNSIEAQLIRSILSKNMVSDGEHSIETKLKAALAMLIVPWDLFEASNLHHIYEDAVEHLEWYQEEEKKKGGEE